MALHTDGPSALYRINEKHRNLSTAPGTAHGFCVRIFHGYAQIYFFPLPVFSIACLTCSLTEAAFSFTDCSFALASK